jgi:osmotically-inducible protein OsmY
MSDEQTPVIFDDLGLRQINELRVRRRILSFPLTGVQRKSLMTDTVLRQTIVDELERAVERIKGVRAIAENIEVRYPGHKQTADDEIAERALSILGWNVQVPKDSVKVKVEKGRITLTGTVEWRFQRMAAESAVRKLSGVVGVTNLIEGRPKVAPLDVKQKILDALKRNAELEADAIRVNVLDDKVVLEGKVKAWYERRIAERAAWSAPGVKAVQDDLALG